MSSLSLAFPEPLADKYRPATVEEFCSGQLVRTNAVDVLRMIAIPAKQAEIGRESKFYDNGVPTSTCHSVMTWLVGVVTARINVAVSFTMVNREKLLRHLATANAFIPIMREHCGFVFSRFVALPLKQCCAAFLSSLLIIGSRLNLACRTQTLSTRRIGTLKTQTQKSAFTLPLFSVFGIHFARNFSRLMTLEVAIMGA
jgi:hypothetical protein